MSEEVVLVEDLHTRVDAGEDLLRVVDGVSFTVRRGETFAIVGESGSGKSMTALSLLRLLPDAGHIEGGRVTLNGEDILAWPESAMRDVRGRRIAMIFQEPGTSLNPVLTVGQQIGEVLRRHTGLAGGILRQRVVGLLESVGIADPHQRVDEYPFQLSGGMKQRVMIALALALEPEILIADEPTTALDVTIQAQVLQLLKDLQRRRGTAMVLITHDLGIVGEVADWVAVMYAGQLVEVARVEAFFRAPRHPYSQKLFAALPSARKRQGTLAVIAGQVPALSRDWDECRFADRCDFAGPACRAKAVSWTSLSDLQQVRCVRATEPEVVEAAQSALDRGPGPAAHALASPPRGGAAAGAQSPVSNRGREPSLEAGPLLQVSGLRVHFPIRRGVLKRAVGYVRAVDDVSLAVAHGETLALVGESGCGKTTIGKAIVGLVAPTVGSIVLDGQTLASLTGAARRGYRRKVQIIFQDPFASLDPRMQVGEIVKEGMRALGIGEDETARTRRAIELIDQVGLPASALQRYPHEFSGGQRQRIAIARALAVDPQLIVCDEPTSALDVSVQAQILNLLRRLQEQMGVAYVFITHNIAVVDFLALRVAVMYLGRIVEEGPVEAVLRSPRHPYTAALLAAAPVPGVRRAQAVVRGEMPSPVHPPAGCHFHPRCPYVREECRAAYPARIEVSPGHDVACVLAR